MSNLSLVEATLPPGFRFHPKDDELICDYLLNKLSFCDSQLLVEIDLNKCEPWDLSETACVGGAEWYFYSQRDRKYATGLRTNRATLSGYWKATGKDRYILRNRTLVGMRKTLVFYLGRAPKGKKTDWVMHEFRVQGSLEPQVDSSVKEDWVLCRVFCKNRETISDQKQISNMGSKYEGHDDTLSCSSSLPPLMDPYTLSFYQSQLTSFSQSQLTTNDNDNNNIFTQQRRIDLINNNHHLFTATSTTIQPSPPLPSSSSSSHCREKKDTTIKSILSRLNVDENDTFKGSSLSFGEGISDQSFLSDEALPVTMWYP